MEHLVIIGNGISGITTARHVRKRSNMKITVISKETQYFFSRTALMYIYMGHMKFEHTKPYEDSFWEKNRINLIYSYVTDVDVDTKTVFLEDGRTLQYDKLVIATGSKSNKFGWPGQDLPGVQGFYSYQDVLLLEENTRNIQHAVIVGGGLIGIEMAEMLHTRNIPVTFLVREQYYWDNILPQEEARLVSRHIVEHGMEIRFKTNLKEILPGEDGRVRAVVTEFGEEIPCQLVALTPGVHPNIDLASKTKIATNRGVLVNEYLETNIPDVYACGDCAEIVVEREERHRIEQLWYTGKLQGMALAKTICGERTRYDRGIWFNSAKFLDIEYQTYGFVSNVPREGEESFYWEHPDGKHAIRIVYNTENRAVVGMNFFGIRMRHPVCEQWIKEQKKVEYVVSNLREANFDPEFYTHYEKDILRAFNQMYHTNLTLNQKSQKLFSLFSR
ncbi:MAG: NAD(P)/FAD-dependent oxidoreductase [Calditrichaeota bacterium]|nr:MAG: NAD(P)/FAD-dependent oxidoreductase [Calditrichota bacterium]